MNIAEDVYVIKTKTGFVISKRENTRDVIDITMRETKCAAKFRRDYKREKSGRHGKKVDALLLEVVNLLAADEPLPRRYFDHALSGEWSDHRDCHIRPDLVLIYRKPDDESLELVRLGSHSELFL
jgi:mRNA interferase YafQ